MQDEDDLPYDILPVIRRAQASEISPEVEKVDDSNEAPIHCQKEEQLASDHTLNNHVSNNNHLNTNKNDELDQPPDNCDNTDDFETSSMPQSHSEELLRSETQPNSSASGDKSDADTPLPINPSSETFETETATSSQPSQNKTTTETTESPETFKAEILKADGTVSGSTALGETDGNFTVTQSSLEETSEGETPVRYSKSLSETEDEFSVIQCPEAEILDETCSITEHELDVGTSSISVSPTEETLKEESFLPCSMTENELDGDSFMSSNASTDTLTSMTAVICPSSESESDADSSHSHNDTVVPMRKKSIEAEEKRHMLCCLIQEELARVNHAFRSTSNVESNDVVLRSKAAETSLQADIERKTGIQLERRCIL